MTARRLRLWLAASLLQGTEEVCNNHDHNPLAIVISYKSPKWVRTRLTNRTKYPAPVSKVAVIPELAQAGSRSPALSRPSVTHLWELLRIPWLALSR